MKKKCQKGVTLNSAIIGITIILILFVGAFYIQKKRAKNLLNPEKIVKAFYSNYFDFLKEGKKISEMNYKESPYLTEDFKNKVDDLFQSSDYTGNNPFACTQDFSKKDYQLKILDSSEEEIKMMVDNYFSIILVPSDKGWLIDNIDCDFKKENKNEFIDFEKNNVQELEEKEEEKKEEEKSETINIYDNLTPETKNLADRAASDLAQRLSLSKDNIQVSAVVATFFSDYTLGISSPGEIYPQTPVSGYIILLTVNEVNYKYHASNSRVVFIGKEI